MFLVAGINISSKGTGDGSASTILGIVLLGIGVLLFVVSTSRSGDRVFMFDNGFVYLKGGEVTPVLWDNVAAIYQRIVEHRGRTGRYTTYTYTVEQGNGTKFLFNDNFNDMPNMCSDIESAVGRRLLPKAIRDYEMGKTVSFGKLSINKNGISNDSNLLPWNEVNGIRINSGFISVKKTGKWLNWSSFYTPNIPNLTVCQLLIEYVGRSLNYYNI